MRIYYATSIRMSAFEIVNDCGGVSLISYDQVRVRRDPDGTLRKIARGDVTPDGGKFHSKLDQFSALRKKKRPPKESLFGGVND